MATFRQIINRDRHPGWLVDAIILSAVAYHADPQEELRNLEGELGLPGDTANYRFMEDEDLRNDGFDSTHCKQVFLVVKSLAGGHIIIACRGTTGFGDALTDLNITQRSLSMSVGAAHAGFLDRAKSIPLNYFRRLLIRGERLVLTGHSLGGAVASLLTLRLLESTGGWCHEQVQCYTFGCPFFADSTLARHINSRYRKHFVHMVSRNDIVPKVMPLAHTLYTLWAGLEVGPLQDLFNVSRLAVFVIQLLGRRRLGMLAQAVSWLPGLLPWVAHRLLALALSYHSGYAFAGRMVLLEEDELEEEEEEEDGSYVEKHLVLKLGSVSLDGMREHRLLSYIRRVFTVQSANQKGADSAATVDVHTAEVNLTVVDRRERKPTMRLAELDPATSSEGATAPKGKGKGAKVFRSKVACMIFAKRMEESSPVILRQKRQRGRSSKMVCANLGRLARFARRFDTIFLASSVYCVFMQLRKFYLRK